MTGRLREELERIADAAPVADVPHDTWARARRAQRRDRVTVAGAAAASVAAVALVAGLLAWLPARTGTPVAAGDAPGVPGYVWAVPERMAGQRPDGSWSEPEVTSDLAVGRGAVAFETWGLPVVVGASDGAYHLLDLPGWIGSQLGLRTEEAGLTLSPDGRKLAYAWAGRATATAPVPSGVRVVDLESGDVRTIPVRGGEGVLVQTIVWSPDSSWLVWSGDQQSSWTADSMRGGRYVAGRIGPGSATSEPVPSIGQDESTAFGVADTGAVTVATRARLLRWDGDQLVVRRVRLPQVHDRAATLSPDGAALAFGSWLADSATSVDTGGGRLVRHRLPADVYPSGGTVRPLGWIDDDLVVSEVQPATSSDQRPDDAQIVVATRAVSRTSTYRIVAHLQGDVGGTVSVAVDLMTLDRPTVTRPEPDWPWSDERLSLTIGLGVAGALSVLYGIRWLWRRRRRL